MIIFTDKGGSKHTPFSKFKANFRSELSFWISLLILENFLFKIMWQPSKFLCSNEKIQANQILDFGQKNEIIGAFCEELFPLVVNAQQNKNKNKRN